MAYFYEFIISQNVTVLWYCNSEPAGDGGYFHVFINSISIHFALKAIGVYDICQNLYKRYF